MVERKHHSFTEVDSAYDEVIDKSGRETVVRLSLYAVLGFLVLIFSVVIGFLFSANAQRDGNDRMIRDRVIVLESKFDTINNGIVDLKASMNSVAAALQEHERQTRK